MAEVVRVQRAAALVVAKSQTGKVCVEQGGVWMFKRCIPKTYLYAGAGAVALIGLLAVRRFSAV